MATSAIDISEDKKNLKKITDGVADYDDYVIITKPKNVMLWLFPRRNYQSWQETMYLLSTEANHCHLDESLANEKR